jgi:hypothetical protein
MLRSTALSPKLLRMPRTVIASIAYPSDGEWMP